MSGDHINVDTGGRLIVADNSVNSISFRIQRREAACLVFFRPVRAGSGVFAAHNLDLKMEYHAGLSHKYGARS